MNSRLILRAGLLGLAVVLIVVVWNAVKDANDGLKLIFFIFVGAGFGIWAIKSVLPRLGDAMGTFVYSSAEEIEPDDRQRAASKMAQGDFKGAIKEYEKLAENDSEDPHSISEIARIHSHFLHDPMSALRVLERGLEEHPWPQDAAVFLQLRMVDILLDDLHDDPGAYRVLEQVVTDFPNTRHSANARHRIQEMRQTKNQQVRRQLRNPGGRNSANPVDLG